jgi:hypothetical protein
MKGIRRHFMATGLFAIKTHFFFYSDHKLSVTKRI